MAIRSISSEGEEGRKLLAETPADRRFALPSGRVILLREAFTAEELEWARSAEGIAVLETLADEKEKEAAR